MAAPWSTAPTELRPDGPMGTEKRYKVVSTMDRYPTRIYAVNACGVSKDKALDLRQEDYYCITFQREVDGTQERHPRVGSNEFTTNGCYPGDKYYMYMFEGTPSRPRPDAIFFAIPLCCCTDCLSGTDALVQPINILTLKPSFAFWSLQLGIDVNIPARVFGALKPGVTDGFVHNNDMHPLNRNHIMYYGWVKYHDVQPPVVIRSIMDTLRNPLPQPLPEWTLKLIGVRPLWKIEEAKERGFNESMMAEFGFYFNHHFYYPVFKSMVAAQSKVLKNMISQGTSSLSLYDMRTMIHPGQYNHHVTPNVVRILCGFFLYAVLPESEITLSSAFTLMQLGFTLQVWPLIAKVFEFLMNQASQLNTVNDAKVLLDYYKFSRPTRHILIFRRMFSLVLGIFRRMVRGNGRNGNGGLELVPGASRAAQQLYTRLMRDLDQHNEEIPIVVAAEGGNGEMAAAENNDDDDDEIQVVRQRLFIK